MKSSVFPPNAAGARMYAYIINLFGGVLTPNTGATRAALGVTIDPRRILRNTENPQLSSTHYQLYYILHLDMP